MKTSWPSALVELISRELADEIRAANLEVVALPIVSPNSESASHVFGAAELRGKAAIARFDVEVIDVISECRIVRGPSTICNIGRCVEKAIHQEELAHALARISVARHYDFYGILLARASLFCDVIASRLLPVFSDAQFSCSAALHDEKFIHHPRIAQWLC